MHLLTKIFIFLVFCFPTIAHGQARDTTVISTDSLTGVKKIIRCEFIGSGGGYSGKAPRLTKSTITRYDKNGKVIYSCQKIFQLRGCMGSTRLWEITATDTSGVQHTLKLKRNKIWVKEFDSNGKLISSKVTNENGLEPFNWIDKEDNCWCFLL